MHRAAPAAPAAMARTAALTSALTAALLATAPAALLGGCSSESEPAPAPELDTSYLESLEEEMRAQSKNQSESQTQTRTAPEPDSEPEPEPEAAPEPEAPVAAPPAAPPRELRAQRESASTFGRARDMARDIGTQARGGRDATLADVGFDERWIGAAGLRIDTPESWQIAIPGEDDDFEALAIIESRLGNAEVRVTSYPMNAPPAGIVNVLGTTVVDDTGRRQRPRLTKTTIGGIEAHRTQIRGTLIAEHSPTRREQPFHMLDAVVFAREGHARVLFVMAGPEDTLTIERDRWNAALETVRDTTAQGAP